MKEFCDINGILRQFIVPYNLKQNGVMEQKNKIIAWSMLDHAKSSNGFWFEAMAIDCFIQNKIFTSTLKDITPYEAWYGVKLNVNNFNIFLLFGICSYSYWTPL